MPETSIERDNFEFPPQNERTFTAKNTALAAGNSLLLAGADVFVFFERRLPRVLEAITPRTPVDLGASALTGFFTRFN